MFITDELDQNQFIERIQNEHPEFDIPKLLKDKKINIVSSLEWYFSDNLFDIDTIKLRWKTATADSISNKSSSTKPYSKGLRAFGDVKSFFKIYKSTNNENINYVNELITYEGSLEKRFSFPLNAICAYEAKDISKLDKNKLDY